MTIDQGENRFVASALLVAGVCAFAFVALHGPVEMDSDTQGFIDNFVIHVRAQESWGAAQTLRMVAYVLWMVGLIGLVRRSDGDRARRVATYASHLVIIGTGLWLVHVAAEFGTAWLLSGDAATPSLGYSEMAKGLRLVDVGILTVAGFTYSMGLVSVGWSLLSSPYPRWFGWSLIGISAPAAVLAVTLGITSRFSLVNFVVLSSVGFALWSVVIGVIMLHRRGESVDHRTHKIAPS